MKIHIITGHFHPQLHPRAFRSNELAVEFARRGHQVYVTNCTTVAGFDYASYAAACGIKKISNLDFFVTPLNPSEESPSNEGIVKNKIHKIAQYLVFGVLFPNARKLSKNLHIDEDTDLVISLSTPFTSLLGTALYLSKHHLNSIKIADSGDPFYYSRQYHLAPWFKPIEKWVYKHFDFLTIPTENAKPLYAPIIESEKIRIIPQGFRMDNLKLYQGDFNGEVRIAYAGVFYKDIRNPEFLFRHLSTEKKPFKLYLFMRNKDPMIDEYVRKYPSLEGKIIVNTLPHDELIYELSRMNFLINIENESNTQIPSKLIDYGITGRPILSCSKHNFSPEKFERFMDGDYSGQYEIDTQRYNIRHIADEMLELI